MRTAVIIKEINRLPIVKRVYIAEQTLHSIRMEEQQSSMKAAADTMLKSYQTDKDLTTFTQLDCENFYETR